MKNTIKVFEAMRSILAIIAFVAVIGFTMTVCEGGGGSSSNGKMWYSTGK